MIRKRFIFFRHVWEDKAADMLRVIQLNTLEDRSVHDKYHWDSAIKFLEHSLKEKLAANDLNLREQVLKTYNLKAFSFKNHWQQAQKLL
jgi:optic atrophy protein 1